jgi:hypothetical protein
LELFDFPFTPLAFRIRANGWRGELYLTCKTSHNYKLNIF